MRVLSVALVALIVLIQYPLWFGKGSWSRVWEVDQQIKTQRDKNTGLHTRNSVLEAEVRDLKHGLDAIEERARSDLGMIKQDEVYFQVLERGQVVPAGKPPALPAAAKK
ncbi:MAG: cell division protein FtsB [Betaproteobacteria bacterium]|nr:cell division protein FtsB [Betaproteobacteria bacterium]